MKIKVACLVALSVLTAGAFVSPANANPAGDRPTSGPAILAQRSERRVANPEARSFGEPIKGRNYIGAAGSTEGAGVNGKYALSNNFSVRPGVMTELGDTEGSTRDVTLLAPITYDFGGVVSDRFLPFIGAGAGVTTGDETDFQVVATAGADVQLGNRYSLNGAVNYLPLDDQRVDFVAGLGYRF